MLQSRPVSPGLHVLQHQDPRLLSLLGPLAALRDQGGAAAVLQVVVDQDRDALNDLDTKDKLVLKDKYEMELGTEAILTNNLAAINPNQEIVSDTDLETSETKNTNFSKVTLISTSERRGSRRRSSRFIMFLSWLTTFIALRSFF